MYAQQNSGGGLLAVVLLIVILVTALTQYGCEPQPAAAIKSINTLLEMKKERDAREADKAAEKVYGNMSDEERMRGVVYE